MAILHLKWNDSLPATANTAAYRASKRIKAVGGVWITSGFSPANDLAPNIFATDATVNANRVYEFKVETICFTGGPTINNNGIQENIKFECINPDITADEANVSVHIDLAGTDITKARLALRRQDNNIIVSGPTIVNNVADAIDHTFTGLIGNTAYYVTVELYATVDGGDVISSNVNYLGSVCGGNVSGYQISTDTACALIDLQRTVDPTTIEWTNCDGVPLSQTLPSGLVTICSDGQPINITNGDITISSTTPGNC